MNTNSCSLKRQIHQKKNYQLVLKLDSEQITEKALGSKTQDGRQNGVFDLGLDIAPGRERYKDSAGFISGPGPSLDHWNKGTPIQAAATASDASAVSASAGSSALACN